MLPVKVLVTLAAIYNGTLYVARPLNCSHASIASDRSTNTTWTVMNATTLGELPVFKTVVKHLLDDHALTFKLQYGCPLYTVETTWQTIWQKRKSVDKERLCPSYSGCCISAVILSTLLLLLVTFIITVYFLARAQYSLNNDLQ